VESDLVMAPEGKLLSLATSFLDRLLHSHVFQNDDRLLSLFFLFSGARNSSAARNSSS
jgi:hypothetical protein